MCGGTNLSRSRSRSRRIERQRQADQACRPSHFSLEPERLDALKPYEGVVSLPMLWASQWSSMRSVLCSLKIVQCSRPESARRINLLQRESIEIGGEFLE